ncbi:MAG: ABC transporter ATP-binding protein [Prevotella sp.]|nr:ABC transporter ATP-binding protein [Prevotella sp.]
MKNIQLHKLTIGYRTKGSLRVVAQDISASICGGELTCLLGRNGIGKSTLLRTLSAFQPPLDGDIFISEQPADDGNKASLISMTDKELSRIIGVVLTEKPDVRNMTARELVELGRSPYTGFWGRLHDDDRQVVDEALRLVGIEPLGQRLVHTLSDGERQKVMIAKALAQQTPVILLDEPTAFLDFPSKVEMLQLLRRLAHHEHKTIFLSTHDVELALQLADRIWLMDDDQQLSIGTPQQLALNGMLSHFIERPGVLFDPQDMTIRVNT